MCNLLFSPVTIHLSTHPPTRYEGEYEEAKRKTKESLHSLKLELAEVNDQVCTFYIQCAGDFCNTVTVFKLNESRRFLF